VIIFANDRGGQSDELTPTGEGEAWIYRSLNNRNVV